jgi:GDP-L-fucose synthase
VSFWSKKNVLITGGCGFIGSYLVEELVEAGAHVSVVDNFQTGAIENLAGVRDRIRFTEGDLRDRSTCREAVKGADVVMNLVGLAYGLEYSMKHHGEMLYSCATVQLHMLEAAREANVDRFLQVSSSCVYPDDAPIPTPELDVLTGNPESVNEGYGWAKRIGELQTRYYHKEYGMKIAVARPFNPYGGRYRWNGEKSHVMPTLVKKVMDDMNPLVCWGSGRQRRNFLHVRDAARLMMLITQNKTDAQPVNIGYDDDIALGDLLVLICEVAGKTPKIVYDTTKPEGRVRKCADATLLRQVTNNYQPHISLRDGVAEMIQWYHSSFGK